MIDIETVRKLALSLPETEEHDHFEKPSFSVKKKIFITIWTKEQKAVLKLSTADQSLFTDYHPEIFYPVDNKWGKLGWTFVELKKVRKDMFRDALKLAWSVVAPKSLLK